MLSKIFLTCENLEGGKHHMFKRSLALLCILALALCAVPAWAEGEAALTTDYIEMTQLGQTAYLGLMVDGQEAAGVAYSSSNDSVARVDHGVVMAMGDGTAMITAAYEGAEYTCVVKVATSFSVELAGEETLNLTVGETATLSAAVQLPTVFDTVDGVEFSSSDENVATVDAQGQVTAVGRGICVITATSQTKKTTQTRTMAGLYVSTDAAEDSVVVVVGNEFTAESYPQLLGLYSGAYDWQGFTQDLKANAPVWTEDQFLWIRALETLEFRADGTFRQQVLNAQRKGYAVDASLPGGDTYEAQAAKYQKCYVYNRYTQKAAELNTDTQQFHDVVGMTEDGVSNFAESGVFAVLDGQLTLFYKGQVQMLGEAKDNAWLENIYTPFNGMVVMSEKMAMKLEKEGAAEAEPAVVTEEAAADKAAAAEQGASEESASNQQKVVTGVASMTWHGDTVFTAIVDVTLEDNVLVGIALREGSVTDTDTTTPRPWVEGKDAYFAQYAGKTVEEILALKLTPSANKDHYDGGKIEGVIDAVTGATASSTTIAMAVQDAIQKETSK